MGDNPGPKVLSRGRSPSFEIVVHEGDEPDAVFDLFDAEPLPGKHSGDVFFFAAHAQPVACGDGDVSVIGMDS